MPQERKEMPIFEKKRILVVDDMPEVREFFSKVLEQENCEFDFAENGRLGFEKATRSDFDLIICDIMMPDWDGVDAIKSIHLLKENSKFLVITGFYDSPLREELEQVPSVCEILEKPLDYEHLREILTRLGMIQTG